MIDLHHGDCRVVLATMPSGFVDACITDPPYGDTSCGWDQRVEGWIAEVARVLKPAASIWVFGSMRFLAPLFAEMESNGFRYSQDIVWEKQNGTGFHNDRFRRVHEHAVLFYRGAWADVHHEAQFTNDATARQVRRKARPAHTGHVNASAYVSEDGGPRLARSVLAVRNEHGRAEHETQKPLGIVTPLVRYSVPPGGIVLDPFAGSGSTLLAAQIEGRSGIGIDVRAECFEITARRLQDDAPLLAAARVSSELAVADANLDLLNGVPLGLVRGRELFPEVNQLLDGGIPLVPQQAGSPAEPITALPDALCPPGDDVLPDLFRHDPLPLLRTKS